MPMITKKDGSQIYYKEWSQGPAITFSHGWPLNADAWDGQMHFLPKTVSASWHTIGAGMGVPLRSIRVTTWTATRTI